MAQPTRLPKPPVGKAKPNPRARANARPGMASFLRTGSTKGPIPAPPGGGSKTIGRAMPGPVPPMPQMPQRGGMPMPPGKNRASLGRAAGKLA